MFSGYTHQFCKRHNTDTDCHCLISGAIFDWGDRAAKSGFLFGIHRFNTNPDEAFQLAVYIDVIDVSDSFKLASSSKLLLYTSSINGIPNMGLGGESLSRG